jgi:FMN phosphatase YigB (HAD superfamily)
MTCGTEALLFDLGGVLVNIDFDEALCAWVRYSQLTLEELRQEFRMDEPYAEHERGERDAASYFQHLRTNLRLDATDAQIARGWNAIFLAEISATLRVVERISTVMPCYAFTNSNPTHQVAWMAQYPRVVNAFEQVFVSSQLGVRKPEARAFEAIAARTGIKSSRMMFFDDTYENIVGATDVGLSAVHVSSPEDVMNALREAQLWPDADAP